MRELGAKSKLPFSFPISIFAFDAGRRCRIPNARRVKLAIERIKTLAIFVTLDLGATFRVRIVAEHTTGEWEVSGGE